MPRSVRAAVASVAIAAAAAILVSGCGTGVPIQSSPVLATSGSTSVESPAAGGGTGHHSSPAASPCRGAAAPARWEHVVWVVMENRSEQEITSDPAAGYFRELAVECGLASRMAAITHPSLPNYVALTSGSTTGITDDGPPGAHPLDVPSIFSQLGTGQWRALAESMPTNCYRQDSGRYAVRHNPATYYIGLATDCESYDVPLGDQPDLSARFTFVTPNQIHNTHDSDVAAGDAWLRQFMTEVLDSAEYRAGTTAVFVTFDEAENGTPGNLIPSLVVAPTVRPGTTATGAYTHYSILRTTEDLLGLAHLGGAATAPSMAPAFGL